MSLDPNNPLTPRANEAEKRLDVKNAIINGGMDFSQRGTSFASISSGFNYFTDRFAVGIDSAFLGNLIYTISQEDATISNEDIQKSMRVEVTNPDGSIPTSAKSRITHRIEGSFFKHLKGKDFTLSFYAKSNLTQIFGLNIQDGLNTKIFISDYEITTSDTWEKHEITIPWDSIIQEFGTSSAIEINWVLAAASNLGASNGWQTYSAGMPFTSSNSDLAGISGALGNYLEIAGVMLYDAEFGENAPFKRAGRNYAEELRLCQRYFYHYPQRSFDTIGPSYNALSQVRYAYHMRVEYPVTMRVSPILDYSVIMNTGSVDVSSNFSGFGSNQHTFGIRNGVSAFNNGGDVSLTFDADAEL